MMNWIEKMREFIRGADEKHLLALAGFGLGAVSVIMWKTRLVINRKSARKMCLRKREAVKADIEKVRRTLSQVNNDR